MATRHYQPYTNIPKTGQRIICRLVCCVKRVKGSCNMLRSAAESLKNVWWGSFEYYGVRVCRCGAYCVSVISIWPPNCCHIILLFRTVPDKQLNTRKTDVFGLCVGIRRRPSAQYTLRTNSLGNKMDTTHTNHNSDYKDFFLTHCT